MVVWEDGGGNAPSYPVARLSPRRYDWGNSYRSLPDLLSLPCRANSSQTAGGNWSGGVMATIPDGRPLLIGPTPIRDWSSRQVSFNRFLKAFKAALSSCGLGAEDCDASEVHMEYSFLRWMGNRQRIAIA
jgi:hypothetical protein